MPHWSDPIWRRIFNEGREAFRKGVARSANPYKDDLLQANEWDGGWASACLA